MGAVLVIDDDPGERRFAVAALAARGWRVDEADHEGAGRALDRSDHALVLLGTKSPADDALATARAIRARPDAGRHVPVLALDGRCEVERGSFRRHGIDAVVARPCPAPALVASVRRWLADDGAATRVRLETLFGEPAWLALLGNLHQQLADMLGEQPGAGRAHRIAGLAGTLGFPLVAAGWLAVSEGTAADDGAALMATRRALHAIDRRLEAK